MAIKFRLLIVFVLFSLIFLTRVSFVKAGCNTQCSPNRCDVCNNVTGNCMQCGNGGGGMIYGECANNSQCGQECCNGGQCGACGGGGNQCGAGTSLQCGPVAVGQGFWCTNSTASCDQTAPSNWKVTSLCTQTTCMQNCSCCPNGTVRTTGSTYQTAPFQDTQGPGDPSGRYRCNVLNDEYLSGTNSNCRDNGDGGTVCDRVNTCRTATCVVPPPTNPTASCPPSGTGPGTSALLGWEDVGAYQYAVRLDDLANGLSWGCSSPEQCIDVTDNWWYPSTTPAHNYSWKVQSKTSTGLLSADVFGPNFTCTPSAPTCTIYADNANVPFNGSTTIRWSSTNTTSCSVSPYSWTGTSGARGTGTMTSTTTFTANCTGTGGSTSCSTQVVVGAPAAPTCEISLSGGTSPMYITAGTSAPLTAHITSSTGYIAGGNASSDTESVATINIDSYSAVTGGVDVYTTVYGISGGAALVTATVNIYNFYSGWGSCTATKQVYVPVINGVCGSSNGGNFYTAPSAPPTSNLCATGTPSSVTGSGPWNWTCTGSGVGATNASCSANKKVDGDWSVWSIKSSACGVSGTQTRTCTNPAPQYGGANCVGPSTQDYTNPPCSWWQVKDGDVTTNENITSSVPTSQYFGTLGSGGFAGVPAYGTTFNLITLGTPDKISASADKWNANTLTTASRVFNYSYFKNLIPDDVIPTPVTTSSQLNSTGANFDGYEIFKATADFTISSDIDFGSRKVILLLDGTTTDLNINAKINLTNDSGFFLALVNGNITVAPSVTAPINTPALEGIYLSDGVFNTGSGGISQLHVRGSVASFGGISLLRDLPDDSVTPSELFEFAPDQIALFPEKLGYRGQRWAEVAP